MVIKAHDNSRAVYPRLCGFTYKQSGAVTKTIFNISNVHSNKRNSDQISVTFTSAEPDS